MDLTNKRCGECGEKTYSRKSIKGLWQKTWKDYPCVFLTRELDLWVCASCGSHAVTPQDAEKIDQAIEGSIRDQTSQYLEIIKAKSGLTFEQIAIRIGRGPTYISSLYNKKKTPAFGLWNQLKSAAIDPVGEMGRLDPNLDIFKNNLLLRASSVKPNQDFP